MPFRHPRVPVTLRQPPAYHPHIQPRRRPSPRPAHPHADVANVANVAIYSPPPCPARVPPPHAHGLPEAIITEHRAERPTEEGAPPYVKGMAGVMPAGFKTRRGAERTRHRRGCAPPPALTTQTTGQQQRTNATNDDGGRRARRRKCPGCLVVSREKHTFGM